MQNKKSIFDIIINIILILLAILIIYWFIKLIFGSSPELSEFNFALIIMTIGLLTKLYRETGELKTEIKYISAGIKHSFANVKEDFNKTNDALSLIKEDMSLIKKKLKI